MPLRLCPCALLLLLAAGAVMAPALDRAGLASPAQYAPFPAPDSGYVTDLAHALTAAEQEEIEGWLWRVEKQTSVEMCVVTVDSMADYPGTPNQSVEPFAKALFNRWGIGNQPKNDGVLLLICVMDRKARIELGGGYGRARDAAAARIMEEVIVPRFRQGDYRGGIKEGVRSLMLDFAGVRVGWNWPLIGVVAAIPVVGLTAFSLFRHGRRGWGWVFLGLTIVLILTAIWTIIQVIRALPRGRSSSWSSGGIGGFGGGFSGGGGATGSW